MQNKPRSQRGCVASRRVTSLKQYYCDTAALEWALYCFLHPIWCSVPQNKCLMNNNGVTKSFIPEPWYFNTFSFIRKHDKRFQIKVNNPCLRDDKNKIFSNMRSPQIRTGTASLLLCPMYKGIYYVYIHNICCDRDSYS